MREDDDQFRNYVPLLRRIIILVAVLTAVPVVLWTITAFVRSYVGPPRTPTFHQLAATEPNDASANINPDAAGPPQSATEPPKPSDPAPATLEARAAAMVDARDASATPKRPVLADRSPDSDASMPTSAMPASAVKMTDASLSASPSPKTPDMVAVPPPGTKAPDALTVPVMPNDPAATTGALAAQRPAAASEPPADTMPAAVPLAGPIPLPRRRPHIMAEAPLTQMAQVNVPMPRPRPDTAGPATPSETSAGPLDFLQNILH